MTQPITTFDKPTLRTLRASIDAALAGVATTHGIRVRVGNARFTDTTADFKLELVVDRLAPNAQSPVPESKEAAAFRRLAPRYGFRSDQLGATLTLDGTPYVIVGLRPGAPKRPIVLAQAANSTRRCVASPDLVLSLLARAAA